MENNQSHLVPVSLPSGRDAMELETLKSLREKGYVWFKGGSHADAMHLKSFVGQPILETHIQEKPGSKAMLAKKGSIGPHTDHHECDFILWYVHEHCDTGGETLIYPVDNFLKRMNPRTMFHANWNGISCKEHKVFPDDPGTCEVLNWNPSRSTIFRVLPSGSPLVYYSFWLADLNEEIPDADEWFKLFQKFIEKEGNPMQGHLKKGDIFIFDNRRNLHARTEYFNSQRHIERHWIKAII